MALILMPCSRETEGKQPLKLKSAIIQASSVNLALVTYNKL